MPHDPQTDNAIPAAWLFSLDASAEHKKYRISPGGIIVGRDAGRCDAVLAGRTISRVHCRMLADEGGRFLAVDMDSTNGTFINGQRVSGMVALQDGDIIGLGSSTVAHFRFQLDGELRGSRETTVPARDTWVIGRSHEADISLPFDPTVSAKHALVIRTGGQLYLVDQDSLNGTWINGQRIHKARISETDTVVIGSTYFHFRLSPDGALSVIRNEHCENIQVECIGIHRAVAVARREKKELLHDISLSFSPGEFVGILGPSGAGKTTLLKTLNGYAPPDSGCVLLNECPLYRSYEMFRSMIGYVPQDDILYRELNVEMSLEYAARLRLPRDLSEEQRKNIVDATIEALGLGHVRQHRISQLSGGQRKRVSIGAELLTRPRVLFLDEPTSGLDPSVEERLMRHFREMSRNGTTVLITTHVLYNLALLDKVVFLAKGRVVFYGTPEEARDFFSSSTFSIERSVQFFDLLEGRITGWESGDTWKKKTPEAIAGYFAEKYRRSVYFEKNVLLSCSEFAAKLLVNHESPPSDATSGDSEIQELLAKPTKRSRHGLNVQQVFSPREWLILSGRHVRMKLFSARQALIYLLIPMLLALVTLTQNINGFPGREQVQQRRDEIVQIISQGGTGLEQQIKWLFSPAGLADQRSAAEIVHGIRFEGIANLPIPMSVLVMFVMAAVFSGTLISCQEISREKSIFQRERMAGQGILDYACSKLPFCLLVTAVQCLLFLLICFVSPELRAIPFFRMVSVLIMLAWVSVAMGLVISALDPTPGNFSILLAIIAVLPQLILSGGLGPDFYKGMNVVTRMIADLLPARWGLELLLTACYDNPHCTALPWIPDFVSGVVGFDFGENAWGRDLFILSGQFLGWIVLTILLLKRRNSQ